MRQKLGIAVALAKGASTVLLDEPTSGLVPRAAQEFMNLLRALRTQGKAILMSSHDVFRVQGVADQTGILKEGKLVVEQSTFVVSLLGKLHMDLIVEVQINGDAATTLGGKRRRSRIHPTKCTIIPCQSRRKSQHAVKRRLSSAGV